MLNSRLTQMGYDIVDECRKQGWSDIAMKQHVNYYYDNVLMTVQNCIAEQENFYNSRYGLLEQVAEEYAKRKEQYAFVNEASKRIDDSFNTKTQTESQPGNN